MAATETYIGEVDWGDGHMVQCVELSTIEPGATVAVEHHGPTGINVLYVTHEVTTAPTSRDVVQVNHIRASDSISADTCAMQIDTTDVGDLTGAVVRLYFHFREAASGGLS
jgi:hypothetical protein